MRHGLRKINDRVAWWGRGWADPDVRNRVCPTIITFDMTTLTFDSSCKWWSFDSTDDGWSFDSIDDRMSTDQTSFDET